MVVVKYADIPDAICKESVFLSEMNDEYKVDPTLEIDLMCSGELCDVMEAFDTLCKSTLIFSSLFLFKKKYEKNQLICLQLICFLNMVEVSAKHVKYLRERGTPRDWLLAYDSHLISRDLFNAFIGNKILAAKHSLLCRFPEPDFDDFIVFLRKCNCINTIKTIYSKLKCKPSKPEDIDVMFKMASLSDRSESVIKFLSCEGYSVKYAMRYVLVAGNVDVVDYLIGLDIAVEESDIIYFMKKATNSTIDKMIKKFDNPQLLANIAANCGQMYAYLKIIENYDIDVDIGQIYNQYKTQNSVHKLYEKEVCKIMIKYWSNKLEKSTQQPQFFFSFNTN